MSNLKMIVKNINALFVCILNKIKWKRGLRFGKSITIVNGKNIDIGLNVTIRSYTDIFAENRISIGNNCDIGIRNRIGGDVIIEDNVLLGPNGYICSSDHEYRNIGKAIIEQGAIKLNKYHDEVKIKEGSWIGINVAIVGCVHIGKHSIIGANSVVTKDIPDYSVAVGNPAKVIKYYDFEKKAWVRV